MRRLLSSFLLLTAVPAIGSLVPALVWLAFMTHNGNAFLGLMMLSLVVTARTAMRVLDRRGVTGMWVRLAWIIAAAMIGITIWGVILSAGGASG